MSSPVEQYREALPDIFDRELSSHDGISARRLLACERRLGVSLPRAIRDFYLLAGDARETREHNRLLEPEDIDVEDGYLVFMHENQDVVHWGVRLSPTDDDPEVWQRVNTTMPDWHSEEACFSRFIVKNLAWQRGVSPPRHEG